MKYIYQLGIILGITIIGEILNKIIPLPVPASIYGLLLLLLCLETGIVKLEQIKETANFFLEIMPLLFIPAAAGIIVILGEVKAIIVPFLIVTLSTTLLVMIVTGKTAQFIIRHKKGGNL